MKNWYKSAASIEWGTHAGNFTANYMVNVELSLQEFSVTKIVTWKCHVNDNTEVRYDMSIVPYLFTNTVI